VPVGVRIPERWDPAPEPLEYHAGGVQGDRRSRHSRHCDGRAPSRIAQRIVADTTPSCEIAFTDQEIAALVVGD